MLARVRPPRIGDAINATARDVADVYGLFINARDAERASATQLLVRHPGSY